MALFKQEPKKVEEKKEIDFRPSYSELRKCVMKKESGETFFAGIQKGIKDLFPELSDDIINKARNMIPERKSDNKKTNL